MSSRDLKNRFGHGEVVMRHRHIYRQLARASRRPKMVFNRSSDTVLFFILHDFYTSTRKRKGKKRKGKKRKG
jgi:hypothetical protein